MINEKETLLLIDELEAELKNQELWFVGEFDESKLDSTAPFCCDTMEFQEWLQFIFIPKIKFMICNRIPLPEKMAIYPMGEMAFKDEISKRKELLKILYRIDKHFES